MTERAIFFDRDGTINVEKDFISSPDEIELIPGAIEALRLATSSQYRIFVVSNQSGVARGIMSEDDVQSVNRRLIELASREGIAFDGIYYCPHYPPLSGACLCRKPNRGMIDQALQRFSIDIPRSYVIGDRILDMELAFNVGAGSVMVMTGYGEDESDAWETGRKPDYFARDILDAVKWIVSHA